MPRLSSSRKRSRSNIQSLSDERSGKSGIKTDKNEDKMAPESNTEVSVVSTPDRLKVIDDEPMDSDISFNFSEFIHNSPPSEDVNRHQNNLSLNLVCNKISSPVASNFVLQNSDFINSTTKDENSNENNSVARDFLVNTAIGKCDKNQEMAHKKETLQQLEFVSPPSSKLAISKKGLGIWKFNARLKKKIYISLSGKKLEGSRAMKQCKEDLQLTINPNISIKPELIKLMRSCPKCLEEIPPGQDPLSLGTWGIPTKTVHRYSGAGVKSLFDWQLSCLTANNGSALQGRNLVYSAPTSGGKTLVAELLMLRRLALHGQVTERTSSSSGGSEVNKRGLILFVVPFVSLAEEKASYFQTMWSDMFIGVRAMHGEDGGADVTDDVDVIVCTIERANVIVTKLLEEGNEARVGDSGRGFLLEVMLSKMRYLSGESEGGSAQVTQIVAMSATLPNMADLSRWLRASLFRTDFRPVDLVTMISIAGELHTVVSPQDSTSGFPPYFEKIPSSQSSSQSVSLSAPVEDRDGLLGLVLDTLRLEKSVLVFCPSKKRCELVAARIVEVVDVITTTATATATAATSTTAASVEQGSTSSKESVARRRMQLMAELRQCPVGLCPLLRTTVGKGVAYHHAGLTVDERKILEEGFRSGVLNVLVATSTLAAGVNLPAHRVVIRAPQMGSKDLNVGTFRQMCGRAGRMLLDTQGEAVLMVANTVQEKKLAMHLCVSPMEPLLSALHVASGGGLEKLLLEMVCCRRLRFQSEVSRFIGCTLLATQKPPEEIERLAAVALEFLVSRQFVLREEMIGDHQPAAVEAAAAPRSSTGNRRVRGGGRARDMSLVSTPLGKATALSGISPHDALPVLSSLQRARTQLTLRTGFHPIFLVTPPSPNLEPCWARFESVLDGLLADHPDARGVLESLGADWGELCRLKNSPPKFGCDNPKTCFYRRLYAAVVVFSLVQEMPLNRVVKLLDVKRGQIQQLQKDAAAFCGMAVVFCRTLNWGHLACVLESYSKRLCAGVQPELLPLVRLGSEVPGFRARALYRSGVCSALDIVRSSPEFITQILMDSMPYCGKDPLKANTMPLPLPLPSLEPTTAIGQQGGGGGGGGGGGIEDPLRVVCRLLERRIRERARVTLQDEIVATANEAKM